MCIIIFWFLCRLHHVHPKTNYHPSLCTHALLLLLTSSPPSAGLFEQSVANQVVSEHLTMWTRDNTNERIWKLSKTVFSYCRQVIIRMSFEIKFAALKKIGHYYVYTLKICTYFNTAFLKSSVPEKRIARQSHTQLSTLVSPLMTEGFWYSQQKEPEKRIKISMIWVLIWYSNSRKISGTESGLVVRHGMPKVQFHVSCSVVAQVSPTFKTSNSSHLSTEVSLLHVIFSTCTTTVKERFNFPHLTDLRARVDSETWVWLQTKTTALSTRPLLICTLLIRRQAPFQASNLQNTISFSRNIVPLYTWANWSSERVNH